MADISKITLPSGSTYNIKDEVARQIIAGLTFIIAWDGTGTPTAANIPKGVVAGGVTGTLEAASEVVNPRAFYLVKSATTPSSETLDKYDEYAVVKPDTEDSTTWYWEKFGDTKINLTDVVTGVTLNKSTDTAIGSDATFTITQPTIALATGATAGTGVVSLTNGVTGKGSSGNSATVLSGLGTPSTATALTGVKVTTQPTVALATGATAGTGVISVATNASGTTQYLGAVAKSGGATWNSKDAKTAVTGYTPSSSSFVTGVSATSKKLKTTSITGVSGSTTPSVVQGRTSQTTATGGTAASTDNTKILANVSVANETLTIGAVTLSTQTTYSANAPGSITVPTAATATTVATGAVADTDTNGATVVTAASASGSSNALTGLGTPSTASVIGASSTFTNTQPTIELSLADTTAANKVGVITGVSASTTNIKATASGTAVGANGTASAVTGYPNTTTETIAVAASNTNVKGTASGANTAWNSKDAVTALTSGTSITVTKAQ